MKYLGLILLLTTVTGTRMFDCSRRGCHLDLNPHCLMSGHIVLGDCKLKQAVCLNGAVEDPSFSSCVRLITPWTES